MARGFVLFSLLGAVAMGQTAARRPDPRAAEMRKAVDEFRALTARLGVRPGAPKPARRANGGAWHGRLFEYFRNDGLDAVPHEVRQRGGEKSLLRRNQFGFSLGGPLVRRTTFVSLSYEGTRERIARAYLGTLPTAPQRSGDFADLVDKAGQPVEIFDPASTAPNPLYHPGQVVSRENLQYNRERFPANRVPASRLDRVAASALAHYPPPNTAVGPFLQNNYFVNTPESNTPNGVLAKLDHQVRERHKLNVEAARSLGFYGSPRLFPTAANPGRPDRRFDTRRLGLSDKLTLSPTSVLTVSGAVSTDGVWTEGGDRFPAYRLSGYLGMGPPRGSVLSTHRNTWMFSSGFALKRGRHAVHLSGSAVREQVNTSQPETPTGSYLFAAGQTALPGIKNTGNEFASFLLGRSDFAEISRTPNPSYFRRTLTQGAFRDEVELSPYVSFSYGVNLDVSTPRVERYDRQSTVDRSRVNPANSRPGALIFAGRDGVGRAFQPWRWRLEPRLGLAWNPFRQQGTVVRLRYARSYAAIPLLSAQFGAQGFVATPTFVSPNPQLAPAVNLQDGLPPDTTPLPDLRPEAANDTVADLIDRSSRQPVVRQVTLTVERQLPGELLLTTGAYTTAGRDLLVGESVAGLNAIHPDALAFRDLLYDEAFRSNLRPYPQYRSFELGGLYPLGRYRRDAGYLRLEMRSSHGLSFQAYYEISKQMDDYSGGAQDYFNRRNEWSLTSYNRPHRVNLHYAYELPIGPGKRLLDAPGLVGRLASGWSVSGSTLWASGDPIVLRPEFNNTGGVVRFLRVNRVPGVDPRVASPGPEGWFNPAAFIEPPDFSLGDVSRSHPTLRNPGSHNHDLSLTKRIPLSSEKTLEVLLEGFNFLNHANWNDPDPVIGPPESPNLNAGRIIGSTGGRVVQVGLRFSF
jgi:hypothetical protein